MRNHRIYAATVAALIAVGATFARHDTVPAPLHNDKPGQAAIELQRSGTDNGVSNAIYQWMLTHDLRQNAAVASGVTATPITIGRHRIALAALRVPPPSPPAPAPKPAVPRPEPTAPPAPPPPVQEPPAQPSGGVWAELRGCESGGNYQADTGNGYYGAYQFSLATWNNMGQTGLPPQPAPSIQDAVAQRLQAEAGWGQWPSCAQQLGL